MIWSAALELLPYSFGWHSPAVGVARWVDEGLPTVDRRFEVIAHLIGTDVRERAVNLAAFLSLQGGWNLTRYGHGRLVDFYGESETRHAAVGFGNPSQHSIIFSTVWNVTGPISRSTTLVLVPCFSGAKWDLEALPLIAARNVLALQLPEDVDSVDEYADFIGNQVADLDDFVLVGDSFGAVIGLVLALRRPRGLRGLVMSGGFAANPLPAWKGLAARASRFAEGPLYRQGTLRFHAFQLSSRFDKQAEVPHSQRNYRDLFVENTPRSSYTARVTSVIDFDVQNQLDKVKVPTLLITPDDDRLVGAQASRDLLEGIHDSEEVVLPSTGHMFRFTHPTLYSRTVLDFVDRLAAPPVIR